VQIASGRFSSIAHESTGKAAVVELTSGARGDVQIARYSTVVVWCRAFSVAFTSAPLERA
jgi:hypothetical protein